MHKLIVRIQLVRISHVPRSLGGEYQATYCEAELVFAGTGVGEACVLGTAQMSRPVFTNRGRMTSILAIRKAKSM